MQRALGPVCLWITVHLGLCAKPAFFGLKERWLRATLTHLLSCCCPCMHQVDAAAAMVERLLQASPLTAATSLAS